MAKYDIKFLHKDFDFVSIQTFKVNNEDTISIKLNVGESFNQVILDKSTAIKFAKTLRTEINKINNDTNE